MNTLAFGIAGCFCLFSLMTSLAEIVAVRDQPGGKRLLVVDGNDLRESPGGKRLLYVDGSDLRPEPGGERLLFVDGDDIRRKPGGIRIAYLDSTDNTLRRGPGGKILLHFDGKDIRTEPGGKRVLFVESELGKTHMTAALYILKPEIFKLSAAEEEALAKAMAEAAAESDRRFDEALFGKMTVINSNVSDWSGGDAEVTSGKDGFVYLNLKFKNAPIHAIGVLRDIGGRDGIWLAGAPEGKVALAVYEFSKGKLTGNWIPANAAKEGKASLGIENLTGPSTLEGTFTISEAKAPNQGAAYSGTLKIEKVVMKDGHQVFFNEMSYLLTWTIGETQIKGIGYSIEVNQGGEKKLYLVVASGYTSSFVVGGLLLESATSVKDFELLRSDLQAGYVNVTKN